MSSPHFSRRAARFLTVSCAAVWAAAFVTTHVPEAPLRSISLHDKALHFLGYLVLSVWLGLTLAARGVPAIRRMGWVVGVSAAYGAFDELTQPIVGRCTSLTDWLANVCGAIAAVLLLEATFYLNAYLRKGRQA